MIRFFKPTAAFFPWIVAEHRRRRLPVVDCGCGYGQLVRELKHKKIPTFGIDPRYSLFGEVVPRDLCASIFPGEAQDNELLRTTPNILLVCRPCHTGFPVDINACRHPASVFYYVGLEDNVQLDLGDSPVVPVACGVVGRDGERVWSVERAV